MVAWRTGRQQWCWDEQHRQVLGLARVALVVSLVRLQLGDERIEVGQGKRGRALRKTLAAEGGDLENLVARAAPPQHGEFRGSG